MRLIWTPPAIDDRESIHDYIAAENEDAADEIDALFGRRAEQLIEHPMLGRQGRLLGTRELVVHPSYLVVYTIIDEIVWILRVIHTAQRWPPDEDA